MIDCIMAMLASAGVGAVVLVGLYGFCCGLERLFGRKR